MITYDNLIKYENINWNTDCSKPHLWSIAAKRLECTSSAQRCVDHHYLAPSLRGFPKIGRLFEVHSSPRISIIQWSEMCFLKITSLFDLLCSFGDGSAENFGHTPSPEQSDQKTKKKQEILCPELVRKKKKTGKINIYTFELETAVILLLSCSISPNICFSYFFPVRPSCWGSHKACDK